ncbi:MULTISPECIES: FKBP-type peptidyl-prolyl cis-trans isomerase [Empedobacter]|uniref:Peptidyl-prolyl cis-trans isomerase n=1 Tax=Empedobacter falsenii TaxID=343874 RepID=A0A427BJZ1_9FLAO|nr:MULTISPECIES: FKBP-type peptidyl-prolyl cis-trans isomerase [Empedobacter]MBW1619441.1 FKBP-type peptidyl-prolyl cis-trans isomerase [Empedobacter falsenii]MBY0066877.1 FKBP-type peptidyl-prolyl cis-trans isomerase [Empedobacter falsenii]MDH0660020.1 FKBP-type peptidyl-prolyl cis-trans isomerase [Empedobacter sp. GD03865]MDH0674231.1 FKBP-type peptidyl-prolyl cis-trans isomerase [Empedobacter sp. GD03861]MDH1603354.1 FKBP-type peptidyl-prolyl cis-trans isomerase [Empedobacter sp. GD03739]
MGVAELLLKRKQELIEKNKTEGLAFREEYKLKEGVTETESGLLYEIITLGEGVKPTLSDTVLCHYHGTNIKGEVFDSSVQRKKPAAFPLENVIKGWAEGVQLMPVGSKFRFVVKPEIGYKDREISKELGPYSTMIFEVELMGIL